MPERPPAVDRLATVADSRPGWRGLAFGTALLVVLIAVDVAAGSELVIVGAYLLAPFVCAFFAGPAATGALGIAALLAAAVSGAWNDNSFDADWFFRLALVAAGSVLAVVSARGRVAAQEGLAQQRLLAAVAGIADTSRPLLETIERLNDLMVPAFADCVLVDTIRDGKPHRVGVRASGPRAREWERMVFDDPPAPPDVAGSPAAALSSGRAELVSELDDALLDRMIIDPGYREFLREHPVRSIISIPLRSRGLDIGVLALITGPSGRRYGRRELEFSEVLAGRVALALDNAGLSEELMTTEQQLRAVLASLAEAVTVQDREGRLVFANQAAADLLGMPTVEELLATPPLALVERFEAFNPDGSPLRLEQLPGRKVLKGEPAEPLLVRAVNKETGEERWRVTRASAIHDSEGKPAFAVNVIEDVTDAKRTELSQRILAEAGRLLGASLDYDRTVQRLTELVVPELADWCTVSVPGDDGYMQTVAVAHTDPAMVEWAWSLQSRWRTPVDDPTGAPAVVRSGKSEFYPDIPDELLVRSAKDDEQLETLRRLGMTSAIVVPVVSGLRTVGALTLISAARGRRFTEAELELAEELGRRAGAAVENARVFSERSRIAMTLQAGLLPPRLPDMDGWVARSLYRPAGEESQVGGDFYDLFPTAAGWMALIGDVAGRGPAAASLTSMARYTLRTAGTLVGSPGIGLARLNESLRERGGTALCTAATILFQEEEGAAQATASVVCAGHPRPYLIRAGVPEEIGATGPLLGAFEDGHWPPVRVDLDPGDIIVLYTDGVIDARGADSRFGEERLAQTIDGARSPDEVVERIRSALDEFEVEEGRDDTAVLAIMRA